MPKMRTDKAGPSASAHAMLLTMAQQAEERGNVALADTYRTRAEKYAPPAKAEAPKQPTQARPAAKATGRSAEFMAGVASVQSRFNAVVNSEHFTGREARACAYLKTSMSADEIIALLADTPKTATAGDDASEIFEAVRRANAEGASHAAAAQGPSPWAAVVQDINARNGF